MDSAQQAVAVKRSDAQHFFTLFVLFLVLYQVVIIFVAPHFRHQPEPPAPHESALSTSNSSASPVLDRSRAQGESPLGGTLTQRHLSG